MPIDEMAWIHWLGDGLAAAPWTVAAAILSITIYLVGRRRLRRRSSRQARYLSPGRVACFLLGWLLVLVAVASPLDAAAERLLSWHMVQHLLLAMVIPPLLWLGAPAMPSLRGLPRSIRSSVIGPVVASPAGRMMIGVIGHPATGWIAMAITTVAWHVPVAYETAIADPSWHRVEHATMLMAGVLFWRPIVAARPFRPTWPRLATVPYLVAADLVNTAVAATLAFGPAPLYAWYGPMAEALGTDPRLDQQLAAGIMWIPGNLLYLVPAMVIAARHFGIPRSLGVAVPDRRPRVVSLPVIAPANPREPEGGDLLRTPGLGRVLRSPHARLAIRGSAFMLLAAIIVDGLLGPELAPMNLAGTLPWTHWRGVAIVGALLVGNLACFGCPLIAPRSVLRRWITPRRAWPTALRSKWLAAGLVIAWLVAYEAFDPWDAPILTAWILIGFVVVATVVDLVFTDASFCRHVCPLGQYQMATATMSTRTIAARHPATCSACTTRDCLQGGPRGPGCGLDLLVPAKRGNLDCTFCLDCVTACPHENVGLLAQVPGADLADPRPRSGLRSLVDRPDVATLLLAITVGGLVNAVGMTAPVTAWLDDAERTLGVDRRVMEGGGTLLAIAAGLAMVWLVALPPTGGTLRRRYGSAAIATLPIGIAVWLVHLGFHLVTGWTTAEAAIHRVANDLGTIASVPDLILSCCSPPPDWLLPAELLALSVGLSGSLGVAWWLRRRLDGPNPLATITTAAMPVLLWVIAAWMVFQPMDMRGTAGFAP